MSEENVNIEQPSIDTSFLESLPEDIRSEGSLSNIKDLGTLAKSYVSAQRMLGSSIRIPGEDASAETKQDFYKKVSAINGVVVLPDEKDAKGQEDLQIRLGRPINKDGYNFGIPEGIEVNHDVIDGFKDVALKLGLSNTQANELVKFQLANETAIKEANLKQRDAATSFLKEKWGNEFDNHLTAADDLLSHYNEKYPDAVTSLRNSDAANNPILLMALAELGKTYRESKVITGEKELKFGLTPEEASSRISEVMSNKKHAYFNELDPGHDEAVRKMGIYYQAKSS